RLRDRIAGVGVAHRQRPGLAAVVAFALPALGAHEVGQALVVRPAACAVARPAVVVAGVAAHVRHGVDRGGTAEHLAAHHFDRAVAEVRLGLGVVAPVVQAVAPDLADADRDVDERIAVRAARLEQQHATVVVFRQPVREHAARRARADDDVVEFFALHGAAIIWAARGIVYIIASLSRARHADRALGDLYASIRDR